MLVIDQWFELVPFLRYESASKISIIIEYVPVSYYLCKQKTL